MPNLETIWAMYYAGICAMKAHPKNDAPVDVEACATLADEMLRQHKRRWHSRYNTYGPVAFWLKDQIGEQPWDTGKPALP